MLKQLVLKDYMVQKKTFLTVLVYCIFIFIFMPQVANIYIMGAVGITYILLQNACIQDEKNKSELVLISLPVSRTELVMAKYLSGLSFVGINLIVLSLMGFIFSIFVNPGIQLIQPIDVFLALSVSLLQVCIYLPIYFKLGYHKGRIVSILLFMVLTFSPSLLLERAKKGAEFGRALGTLINHGLDGQLLLIWIFLLIIITVVSIILSQLFYRTREF